MRWILACLVASIMPASAGDCRPIDGLDGLLQPGLVLVLGELHGTQESPAFAADVACHAAAAGLAVVLGVELPTVEDARIGAFVDSAGTAADRAAVLAGPRWQSDYQDGRTSRAMLELLDALRRLRATGHAVRVVPFDVGHAGGEQARDRGMGNTLAAALELSPRALTVILTGNLHSRVTTGRAGNVDYEPMAHVLAQQTADRKLIALDVGHGGGSAWICAPDCGPVELAGPYAERAWAIDIDDATRPAGHHGRYFVGRITASPPAGVPAAAARSAKPAQSVVDDAAEPGVPEESLAPPAPPRATGQLSAAERRFQGLWQSYDYGSDSRAWTMRFDGRDFRAEGGPDDRYVGYVSIRDDTTPAQIDFTIEDCRCEFEGMTSTGIYYVDGASIVISAPRPGTPRPGRFIESNADMLRLRRPGADRE